MNYLVSIDPGMSTGVAIFSFGGTSPLRFEDAEQLPEGVDGFHRWYLSRVMDTPLEYSATWISEKFLPRGQSLTAKSVEPLIIEGFMIGVALMLPYQTGSKLWRTPNAQYFAGGKTKAEKKKRSHAWLKEHEGDGLYVTGSMLGTPDADDARSAILHAFGYMKAIKHKPTLEKYFPPSEDTE